MKGSGSGEIGGEHYQQYHRRDKSVGPDKVVEVNPLIYQRFVIPFVEPSTHRS